MQNISEPPPPPPVAVEPIAVPVPTATPPPQTQPSAPAAEPGPEAGGETPEQPPAAQVIIQTVHYDGAVRQVESDEYVVIVNVGAAPTNLNGWRLYAGDKGQNFYFPDFSLQPGQTCRVYTNEHHPESCGFSFGIGRAIWNNTKHDCAYLYDAGGVEVSKYCY